MLTKENHIIIAIVMDMQLIDKVYEILDLFKQSAEVEEFLSLKEDLKKDEQLKKLLFQLKSMDSKYASKYLEIKKQILTMNKVKQYKKLENELFLLSLAMNQKFKSINSKKSCQL